MDAAVKLICLSVMEGVKYFLFMHGVLGFEAREGWKKYLVAPYILAGAPISLMMADGRTVYMVLLAVVIPAFCLEGRIADKIKAFVLSGLVIAIVDLFLWSVLANFVPRMGTADLPPMLELASIVPVTEWFDALSVAGTMDLPSLAKRIYAPPVIGWQYLGANLPGCVFWLCVASAVRKKREKVHGYFVRLPFGWTAVVAVILLGLGLMAGGIQRGADGFTLGQKRMILLAYMLGTVFAVVGSAAFLYAVVSKKRLQQLHEAERENLYLQQKYYEGKLRQNEEIQRFRHDLVKHMKVIRLLCGKNKVGELKEYVEEFFAGYPERDVVYTGNIISDYFISETITELCGKEGFRYCVMGRFPERVGISDTDLCILMANALENAKNAILQVEGPSELFVEIRNYKGHLMICVQNTKAAARGKAPWRKEGALEPEGRQGYGMKNMDAVVQRYGGSIEFQEGEGRFSVRVFV